MDATTKERKANLDLWRDEIAKRQADATYTPETPALIALVEALGDVRVRDALVVDAIPGGAHAADLLLSDPECDDVGTTVKSMLYESVAPDERARALSALLTCVLDADYPLPGTSQAGALASTLAFWAGERARAAFLSMTTKREGGPGARLATLVYLMLSSGMSPGWLSAAEADLTNA